MNVNDSDGRVIGHNRNHSNNNSHQRGVDEIFSDLI